MSARPDLDVALRRALQAFVMDTRTCVGNMPAALSVQQASDLQTRTAVVFDTVVRAEVERARVAGCSWDDIGQALGVTRQAAQKRFG